MASETEFEKLVEQHYPALYRFALTLTRNEHDACDLAQETFHIWAHKRHQVRDQAKVKSWLFTTLHREFLQRHRRNTRFPQMDLDAAEPELPEIPPTPAARLERDSILWALGELEDHSRAAVALFYLEDHSYQEIAEILQIPLGTVKSRISRGIANLQVLLAATPALRSREVTP